MMLRYHQNVSTKVLLDYSTIRTFDILTNTANIYQPNLARWEMEKVCFLRSMEGLILRSVTAVA
jgi:hypothetical protein